jgi:putative hemolysin
MTRQIIIPMLLAVLFSACNSNPPVIGMANPATKHCIEQGGKLRIVTAPDGSESGLCTLKNGVTCDEWEYFKGECPKPCTLPKPVECPHFVPPAPGYCAGGEIYFTKGTCGCVSPPLCDMTPGT